MKFLLLFSVAFFTTMPGSLLLLDLNGKKPPQAVTEFSPNLYFNRSFPIYADDLLALINAIEHAAKRINQHQQCNSLDTVAANRTLVIIRTDCNGPSKITVRLVSRIQEPKSLVDFELVKGEADKRKAQIKVLDFAAYLSQ